MRVDRRRDQHGFTMLETLLTLVLTALIMAPLFGWAFVASRQQTATITRNIDGASVGFLRTSFLRDVASSHTANVGTAANGTDCSGGGSAAAAPTDTVLRLTASTGPRVVYNRAASSEGTGTSLWRRECTGGAATSETELVRDISPTSVAVSCAPRPGMGSTDCGRISLRVDTVSGQAVSMTASLRAGVAIGVVTGGGPAYVSPDVSISVSDLEVYRGETVTFDGTANDPGGSTMTYRWELGDGTISTALSVSHAYSQLGEFTAVFTATTAGGTPASDYVRIRVQNRPPTAVISAPSENPLTVNRCTSVNFAAAGSSDPDTGGSVVRYLWSYGDGQTATKTSSAAHGHAYSMPRGSSNPYTVNLRVEDNDHDAFGNGAGDDTTQVVVTNRAPNTPAIQGAWNSSTAAGGSSLQVTTPATVNFSITGPSPLDPDGTCDTLSYQWLKDGSPINGATGATYAHSATGGATISVKVTDDQGESKTSSGVTLATNTPPTAAFTLTSYDVRAGAAVTPESSSSDPETPAASLVHAWTFPNGTPATSTARAPGVVRFGANVPAGSSFESATYTTSLSVTDGSGVMNGPATRTITVRGAPAPSSISASGSNRTNTVSWPAVPGVAGVPTAVSYDVDIRWCTFRVFVCLSWNDFRDAYDGTATSWTSTNHGAANNSDVELRVRTKDPYSGTWSPFRTQAVQFK